jgi:hypothetical protein
VPPRGIAKNVSFGTLYGQGPMSADKYPLPPRKTPLQGLVEGVFAEEFNVEWDKKIEQRVQQILEQWRGQRET